jgi:hypothetical protein
MARTLALRQPIQVIRRSTLLVKPCKIIFTMMSAVSYQDHGKRANIEQTSPAGR